MLDKTQTLTFEQMIEYCGDSGVYWLQLEEFLQDNYDLEKEIRFPYGKDCGWGVNYKHRGKHICNIHAERGGRFYCVLSNPRFKH